ncbi:MAG: EscU/YscU/HrcU family type III secretion system export apparatus switch protein, partial [Candidatus Gastranaerophilales bacterium]|nr:EscU/YscU/HrcU family type III secretion system export apparatus switch protein [Candidatus Gastranaerophilales bacterium]
MADEDKQFEATQQKLERVKKEGQVIKSKDFSMAVAMLVMFLLVYNLSPFIWHQISKLFILLYDQIPNATLENIGIHYILIVSIIAIFLILGPILFVSMLMGILGDFIQIGPIFTTKTIEMKFDKLNPTKYFKNLFSIKTAFELVKNIFKVAVLGFVGWSVYKAHFPVILGLSAVDNKFAVLFEFGKLIVDFVTKACIIFLAISAADYMVVRMKFLKDQKMSYKEIKDEYKNSEGDPHVKAALRQRRQQVLQKSMMDAVQTADFVVTNPTHVAVALKYDQTEMQAPRLIAKGTELIAKKIIEIAREHGIPVIENPPVARALFRLVELNREIPPELYKAVAEILLFVYNLR